MGVDAVTYHPMKQRFADSLTVDSLLHYFKVMADYVSSSRIVDQYDLVVKMLKYSLANTKDVALIDAAIELMHTEQSLSECYRFLVSNRYFKRYIVDKIKQKDLELGTGMLVHTIKYDEDPHRVLNGDIVVNNLLKARSKVVDPGDVLYYLGESYKFSDDQLYSLIGKYKEGSYGMYQQVTPALFSRILKGQKNIQLRYLYARRELFTEDVIALMTKHIDNIRPYDFSKLRESQILNESRFKDMIGDRYHLLKHFDHYYKFSKQEIDVVVHKYPKYMGCVIDCIRHQHLDVALCKAILANVTVQQHGFLSYEFITTIITWPGITEELMDILIDIKEVQTLVTSDDLRSGLNFNINSASADVLKNKKDAVIEKNLRLLFHINKYIDMKPEDLITTIDSFNQLKRNPKYFFGGNNLGHILKNKYVIDENVIRHMFNLKYTYFRDALRSLSSDKIAISYEQYAQMKKKPIKMNKFAKDVIDYIKNLA